jgi:hypothetical protein
MDSTFETFESTALLGYILKPFDEVRASLRIVYDARLRDAFGTNAMNFNQASPVRD